MGEVVTTEFGANQFAEFSKLGNKLAMPTHLDTLCNPVTVSVKLSKLQ